jgi:AcrR family transcriptional regulator
MKRIRDSGAKAVKHAKAADIAALELPRKPRGRPRSFDRAAALERAIEVFWAKGYEGTSISDLTEAMGINPPSLYAAFGDKERLFLEAIESYEQARGSSCPYREEATARAAFETLLTYMADDLTCATHPRGCMTMMAAATAGSASTEMQAALARRRAESRACMKARIELGIKEGDVPRGTDAGALTDFYATIVTGMSLQARDGATRKSLLATVERAMSLFPPVAGGAGKKRTTGPAHASGKDR